GRIWLAHGITTVRELTDDVPAALERAESWASGRRLGPRLIVSPTGPGAVGAAPPNELPTPVPVRAYSGLRAASALFRAPGAPPAWPPGEHRTDAVGSLLRMSPLNLSYEDVFNTVVESGTVITSDLAAAAGARADAAAWRALL